MVNGLGVLFGTIYNINTPDLYENNAHHKIGWIATWIMTAQVITSLLFSYSRRAKTLPSTTGERAAFLPVSTANMEQHNGQPYSGYRWSGDSGQGTEASSTLNSRDGSPNDPHRRDAFDDFEKPEPEPEDDDEESLPSKAPQRSGWLPLGFIDKYLSARVPNLLSAKILRIIEIVYNVVDRLILVLGFIALATGGVTYTGIFVSSPSVGPFSGPGRRLRMRTVMANQRHSEPTTSSPVLHTG